MNDINNNPRIPSESETTSSITPPSSSSIPSVPQATSWGEIRGKGKPISTPEIKKLTPREYAGLLETMLDKITPIGVLNKDLDKPPEELESEDNYTPALSKDEEKVYHRWMKGVRDGT